MLISWLVSDLTHQPFAIHIYLARVFVWVARSCGALTLAVTSTVYVQINFAESSLECRRMLIMRWFGENDFTPEQCNRRCDVCKANAAAGTLRPEGELPGRQLRAGTRVSAESC
jgi:hypothetical protein